MPRKGEIGVFHHSRESKAKIGHGVRQRNARRRIEAELEAERASVQPRDVRRLLDEGIVSESIRPWAALARDEAEELLRAVGGEDATPQRKALAEDFARVGIILRAELARYVRTGDQDSASRIAASVNARRQILGLLGLNRIARDAITLDAYLASKAAEVARDATNGGARGSALESTDDRSGEGDTDATPITIDVPSSETDT